MTDTRVLFGPAGSPGQFSGSGFLVSDRVAVTAYHVVRDRLAPDVTVEIGGVFMSVRRIEHDEGIDAAVLHLDGSSTSHTQVDDVAVGAQWIVTTGPKGNDPQLGGVVAAVDRHMVNDRGHPIGALQLLVTETLDDFGGYSGSAVRLRAHPDVVVGMLYEQVHSRLKTPGSRPRATNVLYATPIRLIMRRFDLTAPRPAAHETMHVRVEALIGAGELAAADRELARVPASAHGAVDHWYLRARVALARQNLEAAAAYLNEALRRDPRNAIVLAAKIRMLLLSNGPDQRAEARELAARSAGVSDALDTWLRRLTGGGVFQPGIRSATELDARYPFPASDCSEEDEDW